MKILIDARVLTHTKTTGVEIHANNLIKNFVNSDKILFTIAKPKFSNKYYTHFWEHFILPFQAKKYNILFCPSNIAPLFLSKKIKLVLVLHDLAFIDFSQNYSILFQKYYSFIVPRNVKRANQIITVSDYAKQRIIKEFPHITNKITFIHHGIDKIFHSNNNKITKRNYILYVGSFNEIKNFQSVIKAYLALNLKDIKLKMVVPKLNSFKTSLEVLELLEKTKNNKNIELLEFMESKKLKIIYEEAKLFIFPSFHESFGFPPLEAMACGTPVLVSNITAMPEICSDAALYCDPNSILDIQEKITLLLENKDLQKKLITQGIKRVKEFTWENATNKYNMIFDKVIKI